MILWCWFYFFALQAVWKRWNGVPKLKGFVKAKIYKKLRCFVAYRSVFETMGKFQSQGQHRAQRLRYVIFWQIVTCNMEKFWIGLSCLWTPYWKFSSLSLSYEKNSIRLGLLDNYARWDRQIDPQTDIATTRLNQPRNQFSENFVASRTLEFSLFLPLHCTWPQKALLIYCSALQCPLQWTPGVLLTAEFCRLLQYCFCLPL